MLTLTSLTIWLRWEQAGSSGSGFTGRGETDFAGSKIVAVECSLSPLGQPGFAGSKLVALDLASLVAVDLDSLIACW